MTKAKYTKVKRKPQPKKVKVIKNISDDKIPRELILQYGDSYYVLKAGLEWKANRLFGGAGYSIDLEPIEIDREANVYVFKAVLVVLENGATFVNYGEAHLGNSNSMMKNNLLHLAATRAECRVLRMATACGYASYDEVKTIEDNGKTEMKDATKPATENQIATLKTLNKKLEEKDLQKLTIKKDMTKAKAASLIREMTKELK